MIKARRIGHAAFETPDLARAIEYYTRVNGLVLTSQERNRAFLATKVGQLVLELTQADTGRCTKLSFEVAPHSDFDGISRHLTREGIRSDIRSDPLPGTSKSLTFQDPKGTTIELFADWQYLGAHHQVVGVGPLKLGHVAFIVHDAKAIADFYQKVLGFRVSDWVEDFFVFMRCGPDHHTINFLSGETVRMHHIAFEVKDFAQIQTACELFGERDIPIIWGPLRHGPGHNVSTYHRNPDDQVVEFYTELDQMKDEELGYFEPRPWHHDLPQRPKVWSRNKPPTVWGPPPTEDYLRNRQP
jgi:catechol 2,3-dioxygenase-like lactoylglutathione lyase family enzyme